jgi:hypothetical protein
VFILHSTNDAKIVKLAPYVEWMVPVEGEAAAYVCQNFTCQKPVTDAQELKLKLTEPPKGSLNK